MRNVKYGDGARTSLAQDVQAHIIDYRNVGGSAFTPASAARNCAVDRRIAEPIGVTDVRVQ